LNCCTLPNLRQGER